MAKLLSETIVPVPPRHSRQPNPSQKACLWRGDVEGAVQPFDDWHHERVERFFAYLAKHRHRIVNYAYYQAEGISIGSGEIESTVKQIGRRMKISGAQWDEDNVQQMLHQRRGYLNGYLSR